MFDFVEDVYKTFHLETLLTAYMHIIAIVGAQKAREKDMDMTKYMDAISLAN